MSSDSRTICHRLPNGVKLLVTFALLLPGYLLTVQQWQMFGVMLIFTFIAHSLAEVPLSYLLRRLLLFLPFISMIAFAVPLSTGLNHGWELMGNILLRGLLSFLAVLWLVNVLPFSELLRTLHGLKVPNLLLALLAFTYRYSFLLWNELERMRTARRARLFQPTRFWQEWILWSQMIGMLVLRAFSRAERTHGAMCARGWDGELRFYNPEEPAD